MDFWLWIQFSDGLFDRNFDSIKIWVFLDKMKNYELPQKDPAPQNGDRIDSEGFSKHS
jgi:hypothetical protein